ncbi:hypothetical protein BU16DRAFT_543979 [Lophium mytilinum]|uniref:Uncharacterized protein n=1 Tax=Lophium mytilinum TaxID=390894 RepID=A0A6A6QC48_9PEZI|nr:hypothetical protein BU16DRAFT_543979 [Lophium mytilinum]
MVSSSVGFQVSLELAAIFPIRQMVSSATTYTWSKIMSIARTLKQSGSDLLVEEELCAVFGRVWVDSKLSSKFRTMVVEHTSTNSLSHPTLELKVGSGPTLDRAFTATESDLATVVQLSLLGATQERSSLAGSLHYALNKRVELGFPEANPSPGFSGLVGTLEAISSQASPFLWSQTLLAVEERLRPLLNKISLNADTALPTNLLVACLDSLPIIQRWPEEYTLRVSEYGGCVTLIAWAHYVLGLRVLVQGHETSQNILFSSGTSTAPNIVIDGTRKTHMGPAVCLLDRENKVYIGIDPEQADFVPVEAQERHPLRDYCTTNLCRAFDEPYSWAESQDFKDAMEFSIAAAFTLARRATRSGLQDTPCLIKKWQIWNAAYVLFGEREFNEDLIRKYADTICMTEPLKKTPRERLPSSLQSYIHERGPIPIWRAAVDIFFMSTISKIKSCENLPLICETDFMGNSQIYDRIVGCKDSIALSSIDSFSYISWRLLGPDPADPSMALEQNTTDIFMVSEFGWTLFLPSFGSNDGDPAQINPENLYLLEGVPTNKKTGERKFRVRDALLSSIEFIGSGIGGGRVQSAWVIENSVLHYEPRCVSPVLERHEFYGPSNAAFNVMIRFMGEHLEPAMPNDNKRTFDVQKSYRGLHDNLWHTYRAPTCEHGSLSHGERPIAARLSVDVATAAGNWSWHFLEQSKRNNSNIPERIVVVLVKNNPRSRWLAVSVAVEAKTSRNTMLRGPGCCEDCAVQAAAKLPGKWFVII